MNDILKPILTNPRVILAEQLCSLFLVVLWLAVVFWMWRDAYRRGAMPWFWALVGVIFPFVGWMVYMVVRPPEYLEDARERELEIKSREVQLQSAGGVCAACLKPVDRDFLICPYCMKKLKKQCTECGKALKLNWSVCPYCKTKQD